MKVRYSVSRCCCKQVDTPVFITTPISWVEYRDDGTAASNNTSPATKFFFVGRTEAGEGPPGSGWDTDDLTNDRMWDSCIYWIVSQNYPLVSRATLVIDQNVRNQDDFDNPTKPLADVEATVDWALRDDGTVGLWGLNPEPVHDWSDLYDEKELVFNPNTKTYRLDVTDWFRYGQLALAPGVLEPSWLFAIRFVTKSSSPLIPTYPAVKVFGQPPVDVWNSVDARDYTGGYQWNFDRITLELEE